MHGQKINVKIFYIIQNYLKKYTLKIISFVMENSVQGVSVSSHIIDISATVRFMRPIGKVAQFKIQLHTILTFEKFQLLWEISKKKLEKLFFICFELI